MYKKCIYILFITRIFNVTAEPSENELEAIDFLNETNTKFIVDIEKFKAFVIHTRGIQTYPVNSIKNGILMASYPDPNRLETFSYELYENEDIKRQLQILRRKGLYTLKRPDFANATSIMDTLRTVHIERFVCFRNETRGCQFFDLAALINLSYMSDNPDEMLHYWKVGRNASKSITAMVNVTLFANFFREAAKLNGFKDTSDMWYEDFEEESFKTVLEEWISEVRPLYVNLHAYVRSVLQQKYEAFVDVGGTIPHHLLGEIVFRANTSNLDGSYLPYPELGLIYFDNLLRARNHRFRDSLNMSAAYFESMGMMPLKQEYFDERSRVSRSSKSMYRVCRNEHFDLDADIAFRFCAKPDFGSFVRLHGDMALMQYAMHKGTLPVGLNRQPCPGFGKGISEAASLSATNFQYLQKIGMSEQYSFAKELHLNMLFYLAVETLFPLMEHFVEDKLWLEIFESDLQPSQYNCHYWFLMQEYAGLDPPQYRTDVHFDVSPVFFDIFEERPAASSDSTHTNSSVRWVSLRRTKQTDRSFVRSMETKKLVIKSGWSVYVYILRRLALPWRIKKSDVIISAIDLLFWLREIMSLGSRRPWRSVLKLISGSRDIDASAILDYFAPLNDWLVHQNAKKHNQIGWKSNLKCDAVAMYFEEDLFPSLSYP